VIVCAHGYSGNARDFDDLARELSRDARVLCIDFPGRGESDWLASAMEYHFPQFLADVDSVLTQLSIREIEWVGTSMGGLLGMLLAARPASYVRRLVMNDVGAYVPLDALHAIGRNLAAPARFDSLAGVEAHLRETHREWGELTPEQWRRLVRHGARAAPGGGYAMHYDPRITRLLQPFALAPGLFFWDAWFRVHCPVLLVRGEHSRVFPEAVAATMLQVKPGAQLVQVAGCGHVPSLMQPAQVATLQGFLGAGRGSMARWSPSSFFPAFSRTPTPSARRSTGSARSRNARWPTLRAPTRSRISRATR
jgi:pimeloyl-ACP methyl ester carboxylesterase